MFDSYFQEALVSSDLRLPESPRSAIKVSSNQSHLQQQFSTHSVTPTPAPRTTTTVTLAVNNNTNRSNKSSKIQTRQSNLPQSPSLLNHSTNNPHLRQTVTVHPPSNNSITVTHISYKGGPHTNGQPRQHHLPDSPPDSGSEPPFSPLNDDKLINSVNSVHQQNPEIMLQPGVEGMKHFINYNNAPHNQLKSLLPPNETSLTVTPPHHSVGLMIHFSQ